MTRLILPCSRTCWTCSPTSCFHQLRTPFLVSPDSMRISNSSNSPCLSTAQATMRTTWTFSSKPCARPTYSLTPLPDPGRTLRFSSSPSFPVTSSRTLSPPSPGSASSSPSSSCDFWSLLEGSHFWRDRPHGPLLRQMFSPGNSPAGSMHDQQGPADQPAPPVPEDNPSPQTRLYSEHNIT